MAEISPRTYYLALGANLGEPLQQLEAALSALAGLADGPMRVSSTTLSPACDGSNQPLYANLCCELPCRLEPRQLLGETQRIERSLGRDPSAARWSARRIDIDLILAGQPSETSLDEGMRLPHPRFRERMFVLQPLAEIAPEAVDPESGMTVAMLLSKLRRDTGAGLLPIIAPARILAPVRES
jgi:2-amino-4-hydroxy-6-hydroxymethyldihydropteridine diphosphokinase